MASITIHFAFIRAAGVHLFATSLTVRLEFPTLSASVPYWVDQLDLMPI
jgi:hypothetical protein